MLANGRSRLKIQNGKSTYPADQGKTPNRLLPSPVSMSHNMCRIGASAFPMNRALQSWFASCEHIRVIFFPVQSICGEMGRRDAATSRGLGMKLGQLPSLGNGRSFAERLIARSGATCKRVLSVRGYSRFLAFKESKVLGDDVGKEFNSDP